MPESRTDACPHGAAIAELARGALSGAAARREQAHLEHCEFCRAAFRFRTADVFPQLPDYTIVENVGKGGFGLVYRAIHHAKQRTEALKIHSGRNPVRTQYFENEVHLIARLNHPHVATLYEAHLDAQPPFYTMEFVEGWNLGEYLRSAAVTLRERIEIVRTVATAIGYAHAQGILHRDIKPQNIMIDHQRRPRIVDFGISKRLGMDDPQPGAAGTPSGDTAPEGAVGTLGYIAPEQLAGDPVDARADIFALGALLYHCVTGEPARFARRRERCLASLRRRRISRAADLAAIIARCVDPLPANRYATCAALIADLDNYLRSWLITAVERPSAGYRAARVASFVLRNHPAPVRVAAVVAATLLFSVLYERFNARALVPGAAGDEIALVAFTPETQAAIRARRIGADLAALSADDRKSWRLLHARLVSALGRGGPRVIVWDYYFPDEIPEFDRPFADAIRACPVPVVVGSRRFDVDSRPEISPTLAAAVHSAGALVAVHPGAHAAEYVVPLAVLRGLEAPIPSLAVAAFAAARFPDSLPVLHTHAGGIELRYRRRVGEGGVRRFRAEIDPLPKFDIGRSRGSDVLEPSDRQPQARFQIPPADFWDARTVAYEAVLAADAESLRKWFAGKLVMVGAMVPGQDDWALSDGDRVFGCQVQALALRSLLVGAYLRPFGRWELVARVLGWSAAGALLAVWLARSRGGRAASWSALAGVAVCTAAVMQAILISAWISERWIVESSFALAGLAGCGALVAALEFARQRQAELAPAAAWALPPPPQSSTLSSTLLRETQSETTVPGAEIEARRA